MTNYRYCEGCGKKCTSGNIFKAYSIYEYSTVYDGSYHQIEYEGMLCRECAENDDDITYCDRVWFDD